MSLGNGEGELGAGGERESHEMAVLAEGAESERGLKEEELT